MKADLLAILEPIWLTKNETASRLRGRIEIVLGYATSTSTYWPANCVANVAQDLSGTWLSVSFRTFAPLYAGLYSNK
ncbi:Hypothetical protein W5S_2822 [Pectobacterium parmentieri]|uniref:Phage integrase central domain-containing protein n=1 Tax=Pectobacterium parmentieri TaxID=1905730 RepID=A0A0H3IAH0_PECPM|nr:Hypothetical protein W5S_2822 [Pectobacterium parmentieri]